MKRLAIIGSGDLGQQIAHHAKATQEYEPVGFFDDFQNSGTIKHGIPVLGKVDDVNTVFKSGKFDELMIGIGYKYMSVRNQLFADLAHQIPFATIIHPSVYKDSTSRVGEGSIIYPGCILDMNVEIGKNSLLNVDCTVAHDTTIGNHCFLSPSVKLAGFIQLADSVNLGINTTVIDNIKIASHVRTGAGAVVINSLIEEGLYVGMPAKWKKI